MVKILIPFDYLLYQVCFHPFRLRIMSDLVRFTVINLPGIAFAHRMIETESVREEYNAVQKQVQDLNQSLKTTTDELAKDYGPEDVFWSIRSECISTKSGQYNYEICFYGKATQDHVGLGKWQGFLENYSKLQFLHGQKCWNGPARSMTVRLGNGDQRILKYSSYH